MIQTSIPTDTQNIINAEGLSQKREAPSQTAGVFRRFFSFLLDLLLIDLSFEIIAYPLKKQFNIPGDTTLFFEMMLENSETMLLFAAVSSFFYVVITLFYYLLFWTLGGQTPGKKILGLKVVTFPENTEINFGIALLRYLGYIMSFITCIGFLWILFDRDRQALHDKIAGTHVIRIR